MNSTNVAAEWRAPVIAMTGALTACGNDGADPALSLDGSVAPVGTAADQRMRSFEIAARSGALATSTACGETDSDLQPDGIVAPCICSGTPCTATEPRTGASRTLSPGAFARDPEPGNDHGPARRPCREAARSRPACRAGPASGIVARRAKAAQRPPRRPVPSISRRTTRPASLGIGVSGSLRAVERRCRDFAGGVRAGGASGWALDCSADFRLACRRAASRRTRTFLRTSERHQ